MRVSLEEFWKGVEQTLGGKCTYYSFVRLVLCRRCSKTMRNLFRDLKESKSTVVNCIGKHKIAYFVAGVCNGSRKGLMLRKLHSLT